MPKHGNMPYRPHSTHTPLHMGPASRKKNLALAPWPQLALGRNVFLKSDPADCATQRNLMTILMPQPQFIPPAARG